MFENDYIMRMVLQLATVIRKSLMGGYHSKEDEIDAIEEAISDATDIQRDLLFSLEPESMVSLLQLGAFDRNLGGYVVRSLYYEADLLDTANLHSRATLRREQAKAIALAYSIDVSEENATPEELEAFLDEQYSEARQPDQDLEQ